MMAMVVVVVMVVTVQQQKKKKQQSSSRGSIELCCACDVSHPSHQAHAPPSWPPGLTVGAALCKPLLHLPAQ
jgi:hypothetical protein